jgi:hypothetical protein
MLNKTGIRGPFNEDGQKQNFWALYPWKLQDTDWRRRIGADFDPLVRSGILKTYTLERVTHPAHPVSVGALAVKEIEENILVGISDDDDAVPERILTASDILAYQLDVPSVANALCASLGLSGSSYEIKEGVWFLGYREFGPTAKISVFLATRTPTDELDRIIGGAAVIGKSVLLIPDDGICTAATPLVLCKMPNGPFNILEDIILRLGLQNEVCPSVWAKADLVINTAREAQLRFASLQICRSCGGSQRDNS